MSDVTQEPYAIVAVKENPSLMQMGLWFFEEEDWPQPGFSQVKIVTGCRAAELTGGNHWK